MRYPTIMQKDAKSYSRWICPSAKYRLACCDCGLVHDLQFRIVTRGRASKLHFDGRNTQVQFRVRRNNRSTAAIRRSKPYKP